MDPKRLYPNSPDLHREDDGKGRAADPAFSDEALAKLYPSMRPRTGYWSMEPPPKPKPPTSVELWPIIMKGLYSTKPAPTQAGGPAADLDSDDAGGAADVE